MFKIDTDVPPPSGARRLPRYPWKSLPVGGSFLVTNRTKEQMRSAADYHKQKRGWDFLVDDCPTGEGIRVWRMA